MSEGCSQFTVKSAKNPTRLSRSLKLKSSESVTDVHRPPIKKIEQDNVLSELYVIFYFIKNSANFHYSLETIRSKKYH